MDNIIQITGNVNFPETFKQEINHMAKRKKGSNILAITYENTDLPDKHKKAWNLRLCGKTVTYTENPTGGTPILAAIMRCQLRLCPSCSWKRAHQIFENVYYILKEPDFKEKQFIFLTLTVKNCKGEFLEREIQRLLSAWQKLTDNVRQPFRRSFLGTFRALEVTYNKLTKTFHPHLHAMAAVEPDYFKKSNRDYIDQAKLRELWRDACRLDYLPQCRIERVWNTTNKQVAEVAKYTVKSADYIFRSDVVSVLDPALHRKRLIAYGGLFREVRKRLNLPDEDVLPESEFHPVAVEELLRNPYIRKIILEWKQGAYHVSVVEPSSDPAEWLRPDRLAAAILSESAKSWGQGV